MTAKPTRGGARPGAGRPPGSVGPYGRAERVQVRIPEQILEALDARADRDERTRSAILVEALKAYLGVR